MTRSTRCLRRAARILTISSLPCLSRSRVLQLIANREGEELHETTQDASIPPGLVGHSLGASEVLLEDSLEVASNALVVDDEIDLVVEGEGSTVKIGAADGGPAAVHDHGLGVEQGRPVFVHFDPGLEQA